jgi:hypothetical protein
MKKKSFELLIADLTGISLCILFGLFLAFLLAAPF